VVRGLRACQPALRGRARALLRPRARERRRRADRPTAARAAPVPTRSRRQPLDHLLAAAAVLSLAAPASSVTAARSSTGTRPLSNGRLPATGRPDAADVSRSAGVRPPRQSRYFRVTLSSQVAPAMGLHTQRFGQSRRFQACPGVSCPGVRPPRQGSDPHARAVTSA
jgi:hypothetical protein